MATELGSAYISVWPKLDGSKWASEINSSLNGIDTSSSGKSMGSKLGDGVGSGLSAAKVAIGNILAKVASAGINAIRGSLDSAISRVDTLNNFPKVMSNIGFSTEEANSAVSKLSAGIDGLPTTLDGIVSSTQSFALSLGNLDQAADVALAVNDGMLAFGASSEGASEAVRQLNQMITTGTFDMQSWNSINSAAPGFLDSIARSMLGESATASQLRDALNDGSISTGEFLDAVIKMDQEGGAGFASFAQLARDSTGGIETSMANVATSVTKNLAKIIDALNKNGVISGIFDGIKNAIDSVSPLFINLAEKINQFYTWITSGSPGAIAAITGITTALAGVGGAVVIANFSKITSGISNLITSSKMLQTAMSGIKVVMSALSGPIGIVVAIVAALAAGFAYLYNTNDEFRASVQALGDQLMSVLQPALESSGNALSTLSSQIMPTLMGLLQSLMPIITQVLNYIVDLASQLLALILPVITSIVEFISANLPAIQTIFETVMNAIMFVVQAVWPNIQTLIETAMTAIQDIINIVLAAINGDWEGVWTGIQQLASDIWNGICDVINGQLDTIKTIIDAALQWISDTFGVNLDSIQALVDSVWNAIQTIVTTAMTIIQDVINVVLAAINGDWKGVWEGIKQLASDIWEGIKSIISAAIDAVSNAIKVALDVISSVWNNIWQAICDFAKSIWDAIKSAVQNAIDAVKGVIDSALSAIKSLWDTTWNTIKDVLQSAWDAIKSAVETGVDNVVNFFSNLPGQIGGALSGLASQMFDIGKNAIQGLLNGIQNMVGSVISTLQNLASQAIGIVSSILRIGSPSKVFEDIGGFVMEGFDIGLQDGFKDVEHTLESASNQIAGFDAMAEVGVNTYWDTSDNSDRLMQKIGLTAVSQSSYLTREDLEDVLNASSNTNPINLYMDSKLVASTIANPMNAELSLLAARGNRR